MGGERLETECIRDDTLLLLATLFYPKGTLRGRTRFQKTVFLLKSKFDFSFSFRFRPYYYGPYSEDLADSISILKAVGVLAEDPQPLGIDIVRYNYRLTRKGSVYFRKLKRSVKKKLLDKLKANIREVKAMSTRDLISSAKTLMKQRA